MAIYDYTAIPKLMNNIESNVVILLLFLNTIIIYYKVPSVVLVIL